MSAKDYYKGSTDQPKYAPQQSHHNEKSTYNPQGNQRGFPPMQQQQQHGQYYNSQPQYYQNQGQGQGLGPGQGQPQYYPDHTQPNPQHPQQPIYVQQQPPQRGNNDCMTACLAAMCLCCTLDMIF